MKTWEMIKMLEENPKLRFRTTSAGFNEVFEAYLSPNGFLVSRNVNKPLPYGFDHNITPSDNWQLVRTPVPAWEAIKALTAGKRITCEYEKGRCNSVSGKCYFASHGDTTLRISCLSRGTWYIED